MRRIMRKIVAGEGDQLGDLSTLAEPGVVDIIKAKVAELHNRAVQDAGLAPKMANKTPSLDEKGSQELEENVKA